MHAIVSWFRSKWISLSYFQNDEHFWSFCRNRIPHNEIKRHQCQYSSAVMQLQEMNAWKVSPTLHDVSTSSATTAEFHSQQSKRVKQVPQVRGCVQQFSLQENELVEGKTQAPNEQTSKEHEGQWSRTLFQAHIWHRWDQQNQRVKNWFKTSCRTQIDVLYFITLAGKQWHCLSVFRCLKAQSKEKSQHVTKDLV